MANLEIKIKGRKFIDVNYQGKVETFEPYHVVANGWDCRIFQNGKIYCEAKENYSDGLHFIKYVINPDGSYQLKLRKPEQEIAKTIRKGSPVIAIGKRISITSIGLTDGHIDNRYGYFVKAD